ncbi:MAG: TolC family protein [Proteobacteria bacterium]|nr:MAG: TolC family protein [Pseudomonadota bacterium]
MNFKPYTLIFGLGLSWPAFSQSRSLTLDEAYGIAMKEATAVLKAGSDVDVRGEQVIQSYLQWLPNLTVQGTYNQNRGRNYLTTAVPTTVHGASLGATYQIGSVLNIFNGLNDISAYESIRKKKFAADMTLERSRQQVALDIAQTYYQVILDAKVVAISEKNFRTSQDRQKLLEAQSQVGTRSLADVFRQQAQTSVDESTLISARNRFETNRITLLKKLRMDPRAPVDLVVPTLQQDLNFIKTEQQSNMDELVNQALNNRQDLKASDSIASAGRNDVSVAEAPYYPRLDFVATYGALGRDIDFQRVNGAEVTPFAQDSIGEQISENVNFTYGLAVSWNIFDRGLTRSSVSVARGTAYRAKIDSEDYRNQVIGEVKQAVGDLNATAQQLIASQTGLTAAQKSFEVSEGRYSVGSLNFIDLSAAQIALFQAETTFAQSSISYELQKRALDFVLGIPLGLPQ